MGRTPHQHTPPAKIEHTVTNTTVTNIQVVYDEDALPFESLLEEFWANHDPTSKDRQGADSGTQYRAGIYTTTPEQLEAAARCAFFWARAARGPQAGGGAGGKGAGGGEYVAA